VLSLALLAAVFFGIMHEQVNFRLTSSSITSQTSLFDQDYAKYRVIFAVESELDAAAPLPEGRVFVWHSGDV
jgi:hypothetical protein